MFCICTRPLIDLNTRDWTSGPIESDNYFVHASRPYIAFGTPLGNQIDSGLINILLGPPKSNSPLVEWVNEHMVYELVLIKVYL